MIMSHYADLEPDGRRGPESKVEARFNEAITYALF